MAEFSPRTVSPEQGCLAFSHRGPESSRAKSVRIKSALGNHKVVKEPPQSVEATINGEIIEVPSVNVEPPQINLTLA